MEGFNRTKALARYVGGYKGGPFYKNPRTTPMHTFANGYPESVSTIASHKMAPYLKIGDPWNERRKRL